MLRVLTLCVCCVCASVHLALAQCPDGTPPPCARPAAPSRPPSPHSVAVLTFDVSGGDTAAVWLGEQLADEITAALASQERLEVRTRTLVRRHERTLAANLQALGRALIVRYVVEGGVQVVRGRLRIRSQLVLASDGHILWSRPFGGATDSLLDAEEAIATAVATGIAGRLLPEEIARVAKRPTSNDAAYREFLHGNTMLATRTEDGMAAAAALYQSAARLDPGFTRALGRLAYAHALAFSNGWGLPGVLPESVATRGLALAGRALGQDPANADALLARGYIHQMQGDYRQARADFRAAVASDSTNAEAWHRLGQVLLLPEEQSAAIVAYLHALALEPERPATLADLTYRLVSQGRVAEAAFWSDTLIALAPDHLWAFWSRVWVRLMQGDVRGARVAFDRMPPPVQRIDWELEASILAAEGDSTGVQRVLGRFSEDPSARGPSLLPVQSRLLLGDREGALDALAEVPVGGSCLLLTSAFWLGGRFDARGDPRYERFRAACEASLR